MGKTILIALGAGLTSALLVAVLATGSLLAMILAYLAPLPIMIAALGFGHISGLLAVVMAGSALAVVIDPSRGLSYLFSIGLPSWWLGYLLLLARVEPKRGGRGMAGGSEWYPICKVLIWIAVLAAAPILLTGAIVVLHYGSFDRALSVCARRLSEALSGAALPNGFSFIELLRLMPPVFAAMIFVMFAFNLWLAARICLLSQRLARPWPDVPAAIALTRPVVAVFAALLIGSRLPDPLGLALSVPAAALGMAFAFQGLAIAHVLTRGLPARRLILSGIYATTLLLVPLPLLGLALLGCLDCFLPLRGRTKPLPPTPDLRS